MKDYEGGSEQEVRIKVFESFKDTFASAPIRLMSRTVSTMRSMGYNDLASAIGDLDWRTVPADDQDDPFLRDDWEALLVPAFNNMSGWLHQLASRPLAYNLDSLGYPAVIEAWSGHVAEPTRPRVQEPADGTARGLCLPRRQPGPRGRVDRRRRGPPRIEPGPRVRPPSWCRFRASRVPWTRWRSRACRRISCHPTIPGWTPAPTTSRRSRTGWISTGSTPCRSTTPPDGPSSPIVSALLSKRCSTVGPTPASSSTRSMSGCTRSTPSSWPGSTTIRVLPNPSSSSTPCRRVTVSPACARARC